MNMAASTTTTTAATDSPKLKLKPKPKRSGRKFATSIWMSGSRDYPTLSIPDWMAKAHNLDERCQIILEDRLNGILIRKFD
jgi:aspartyl aminopeptidase